jgi:hypothetical protein
VRLPGAGGLACTAALLALAAVARAVAGSTRQPIDRSDFPLTVLLRLHCSALTALYPTSPQPLQLRRPVLQRIVPKQIALSFAPVGVEVGPELRLCATNAHSLKFCRSAEDVKEASEWASRCPWKRQTLGTYGT